MPEARRITSNKFGFHEQLLVNPADPTAILILFEFALFIHIVTFSIKLPTKHKPGPTLRGWRPYRYIIGKKRCKF